MPCANQYRSLHPMFEAGEKPQLNWGTGNWAFVDIGFAVRAKSCGLLFGDEKPKNVDFANAKSQIIEWIKRSKSTVNLVIEAPLSASFNSNGNPTGRSIEKNGKQTRYWFVGAGCVVMVAAMYLIRDILEAGPDAPVRLFEGFISYKTPSAPSSHDKDVRLLREAVCSPAKFSGSIYTADQLKIDPNDFLCSAFRVAGVDCGVPAVIKRMA